MSHIYTSADQLIGRTPLLELGTGFCTGIFDFQIQCTVGVLELVYLTGVQLHTGSGGFFQNPVLAGVAVALVLLDSCSAGFAGIFYLYAAFQIRGLGVNGVGAVLVQSEQELLCLLAAALGQKGSVRAVVSLADGDVHEVGELLA